MAAVGSLCLRCSMSTQADGPSLYTISVAGRLLPPPPPPPPRHHSLRRLAHLLGEDLSATVFHGQPYVSQCVPFNFRTHTIGVELMTGSSNMGKNVGSRDLCGVSWCDSEGPLPLVIQQQSCSRSIGTWVVVLLLLRLLLPRLSKEMSQPQANHAGLEHGAE